ncbi:uncharacterized protein PAE49_017594 isoform 1-T1 [Odontesthes bonariensis]|uniref:uncharacterized protein LOC142401759 isoform X1 n=2 Tax=Odontesthes bonariensis TaxID=219752 RepID=UPI003F58A990
MCYLKTPFGYDVQHDLEINYICLFSPFRICVTSFACPSSRGHLRNHEVVVCQYSNCSFRTKLARSGCAEVSINAGKRSRTNPENDYPHSNIKRARRAEVNFLPNFPRGENEATLEEMRAQIKQETEKTERDQVLIEKLMQTTFALRRQYIVQGSPRVRELLDNWPGLRMQSQVFAEFHRITNVNLRNQFYCELDRYTPKIVALYQQKSSRTGKGAEALREMLRIYDLEEEHDINMRRSLALRALPVYLQQDDTEFFKTCNGEDEMETTDTPLALVSVVPDSTGPISFSPENISIVIEDEVVMSQLPRLADAFVVLLGLIYALHLDYPK